MTNRIPPSLSWLIDKRARISGEIKKTRKSLDKANELIEELKDLEEKLAAIDTTLDLHEIRIDKSLIRPITTKYVRLKIPYGGINHAVITCLRVYDERLPIPKSEIVDFVIAKYYDFGEDEIAHGQISRSIQRCLKRLFAAGVVERFHDPHSTKEGLWKIAHHYK